MDEAEKQEILAESRRLLEELKDFKPREHDLLHEDAFEDPVRRWKREADEQQERFQREREARAQQERRTMDERKAQSDAEWNKWCDTKIAAALAEFREFEHDVIAQVIAEERTGTERAIKKAVSALRDELITKQRDAGNIVDLPNPLPRRHGHGKAA
jgi:hypothetical protein